MAHIYVPSTHTIFSENGEVTIITENEDTITFNADSLFEDLPNLLAMCLKERKAQEKLIKQLMA